VINSSTEHITVDEEHSTTEELAASSSIGVTERFIEDIKIRDDTIEELNEKVRNLAKENTELNDRIMVTQMFYDGFRDEMRDRFGYDSDEDAKEHYQELLKKDLLEKLKYSCDKCVFASESKVELKVHGTKKHRGQL
jgi:predicted RNase H-like nuclease (RuvC/YqgF family)